MKIIGCNRMSSLLTGKSTLKKNISFHFTNSMSEHPMWSELAPHVRALCWFRSDPPGRLWSRQRRTATVNWWSDNPPTLCNCKNKQIVDQSERQFSEEKGYRIRSSVIHTASNNDLHFSFWLAKENYIWRVSRGCYPCTMEGLRG